jgi:long-chain acyl-CoA synthetase
MDFGRKPGKKSYSDDSTSTLRMNVVKNPDKPAVICEDVMLTWKQMWERSNRLANAYIRMGLKKGDRVLIFLPNCLEYMETYIAGNKIGLISTAGNFRLTGPEIAYQLNDCGARGIILKTKEQYETIKSVEDKLPGLEYIIMIDEGAPEGVHSYYSLLDGASPEDPETSVDPADVHLLMYTSGTTGNPKAAARTLKSDYHTSNSVCHEIGLSHDDIYLAVAPLYAAASIGYAYAAMFSGGTICVVPAFIPDKIFSYIEKYRATWLFMVPIMYDWMFMTPADVRGKYDTSSLRHVVSCGAPLHNTTAAKMIDYFKSAEISNWLGASEFGFITRYSYRDGLKEDGCIGKALFDLELKIFDEKGVPVKDGESGILYGRGFSMWEGYFNKPEATREAYLDHEWGTVGDIARVGKDGNLYIVDRKSDMIISGGINIYPTEVENVLKKHNDIADLAVIGVPDDKWGESVKAVVVKKAGSTVTEEELIEFCRKDLAGFKVPKSVDFIDQIPRSLIGKALKKELRKKYWEGRTTVI